MRRQSHKWTPEEEDIVRQQYQGTHHSSAEIADYLTRHGAQPPISAFAVVARVTLLGIGQRENHRWTEKEMNHLREWTGRYPPWRIAKKLKMGIVAVKVKMKKMGLFLRTKDGWYTKKDVAEMLGVDHKKIQRWMDDGFLKAVPYDAMPRMHGGGQWYIEEKDVRSFLLHFPQELVGRNIDVFQIFNILVPNGINSYHANDKKAEEASHE